MTTLIRFLEGLPTRWKIFDNLIWKRIKFYIDYMVIIIFRHDLQKLFQITKPGGKCNTSPPEKSYPRPGPLKK